MLASSQCIETDKYFKINVGYYKTGKKNTLEL